LDSLLAALALPAIYLFPWIWWSLVRSLGREGGRALRGEADAPTRFLLAESLIPLGTFLTVSCTRPVLPHWTLVGFLSLFPLMGRDWCALWDSNPRRLRRRVLLSAAAPLV